MTAQTDHTEPTTAEGAVVNLYTALTMLLNAPDNADARATASRAMLDYGPLFLSIISKAGF